MKPFENVTVIPQANVYFDGKVTSRIIKFPDGSKKTLGIMMPGEYTFGTSENELIEIIGGTIEVKLPDSESWKTIETGSSFEVPANREFQVKMDSIVDYCCSYS